MFADLGLGDDTLSIAQNLGSTASVGFNSSAVFSLNSGNDTLLLGRSAAAGGDANSSVFFNAPGSLISGGLGVNTFVLANAQFFGLTPSNFA